MPDLAVRQHYDQNPFYLNDAVILDKVLNETPLGQFIKSKEVAEIHIIADVGCGGLAKNIDFLYKYGHCFSDPVILGTDFSFQTLKIAGQRHARTPFFQANTESLPFKDNSLDFIIATGTLVCMPEPQRGFDEILRAVKPKKYIYISLYNKNNIYCPIYRWTKFLRLFPQWKLEWVIQYLFVPLYGVVYWFTNVLLNKKIRKIPYREIKMDFYDKFMVPVALFFDHQDVVNMVRDRAVILNKQIYAAGMMIGILLQKK